MRAPRCARSGHRSHAPGDHARGAHAHAHGGGDGGGGGGAHPPAKEEVVCEHDRAARNHEHQAIPYQEDGVLLKQFIQAESVAAKDAVEVHLALSALNDLGRPVDPLQQRRGVSRAEIRDQLWQLQEEAGKRPSFLP